MYTTVKLTGAYQVALVVKNPRAKAGAVRDMGSILGSGRSPREGHLSVFLPGESHGQRHLAGYSLQSCKESDTTEVT